MRHQAEGARADMSWLRHGSRAVAVLLAAAALVGTIAACGSGAVGGPDDEASSGTGGGDHGGGGNGGNGGEDHGGGGDNNNGGGADNNGGGGNGGGGNSFSWSLPGGDLSVDSIGFVFNTLRAGKCADAETHLNGSLASEPGLWPPHQERLYRAAIAACSGNLDEARAILQGAGLTDHPGDCRLYKAIRSVLDQRPQGSIDCPEPRGDPGTSSTESTTSTESDSSSTESTTTSTSEPTTPDTGDGGSTSTVGGQTDAAG